MIGLQGLGGNRSGFLRGSNEGFCNHKHLRLDGGNGSGSGALQQQEMASMHTGLLRSDGTAGDNFGDTAAGNFQESAGTSRDIPV